MKQTIILLIIILSIDSMGQHSGKEVFLIENYGLLSKTFINYGKTHSIKSKENFLFVGSDAGLIVFNISNPPNINLVKFYERRSLYELEIVDNRIYLASRKSYNSGLIEILDISDPINPFLIFSFEISTYGDIPKGFGVKDNLIFVNFENLSVIDISNLNEPLIYDYPSITMYDLLLEDDLMYTSYFDMSIYDISDISNITYIAGVYAPGSDIDKKNNYIYTTLGTLNTIDVSDPFEPTLINQITFVNNSQQIEIDENKAYVSGIGLFAVLDILDPSNPEIFAEYNEFCGKFLHINFPNAILSTRYYNQDGVQTLDISDPLNVIASDIYVSTNTIKCRVFNDTAYIANGFSGIEIIDIINSNAPLFVGEKITKWKAVDIYKESNILYVAEADSGIQIFDIMDPTNPILLSNYYYEHGWEGYMKLEKYQNYLYTAGLSGVNDIIDVTQPADPILVGTIPTNDWGPDIQIYNDHLFLAGYWGGFQIYNLEDPVNPEEIGYYPLDLALNITVSNNLAYVYDNSDILIFDISNYNNPQLASTHNPGQYVAVLHMSAKGDSLYYSNSLNQLILLDVSDIINPLIVDSINNFSALSFDFQKSNFVTNDSYSLRIYGDTIISIINQEFEMSDEIHLHQNFPNPCSDFTYFKISCPNKSFINLELFDLKGNIIKTIENSIVSEGDHIFYCNTEKIKTGLYFYRLTLNGVIIDTRKIVIMK